MVRSALILSVLGMGAWLMPVSSAGEKTTGPSKEGVQKAEKTVKEFLEKIKGTQGEVKPISDASLAKCFADDVFINVRYRIYPVARQLPEGMKPSNVFVVRKDGKLTHLKDNKILQEFFTENQKGVKSEDAARNVLACWLTLAQEFHQDGFYKFEVNKKDFSVEKSGDDVKAIGRAIVMQGGNGELNATMQFEGGKLAKVAESAKIKQGPRPICQATKLLDPDPIVRRMAQNDLLYLGDLVKDYLDEQRAQAGPELRQAIDRIWEKIQQQRR